MDPVMCRNAARDYVSYGLSVFPLPARRKQAVLPWKTYMDVEPTSKEVGLLFRHTRNVAIVCGSVSGNLLALDCDTPYALAEQQTRLSELGIQFWTIEHPMNGGDHDGGGTLLLRTVEEAASKAVGDVQVLSHGRYTVGPPSEHPGGGEYFFSTRGSVLPVVGIEELSWLGLSVYKEPIRALREIPRGARALLKRTPAALARYGGDRSDAEIALCAILAHAGYTYQDARVIFEKFGGVGKFEEVYIRNPEEAINYLFKTWHKAYDYVERTDTDAGRLAKRLKVWALERPGGWPGRGGISDKKVYLAHTQIVIRCGKEVYGASSRELARMARVGRGTAAESTRRLVETGRLEFVGVAGVGLPHTYRLVETPEMQSGCQYPDTPSCGVEVVLMECPTIDRDVFRWAGLGASAGEVFGLLVAQGAGVALTTRVIADATGRCLNTVKSALRRMYPAGLVVPVGDGGWCAVEDKDIGWESLGEIVGTTGASERQRRKHVQEMRLHRLQIEVVREGRQIDRMRAFSRGLKR